MKLRRLVCGDIHFQWKYGFYFIYFVLTVIYVFGITALPDNWKHNAAAIMIYSDPAAMGLFFMGAIVLLEKSQKPTENFTVLSIYGLHEFNIRVQSEHVSGFGSGSCDKFCIISGST